MMMVLRILILIFISHATSLELPMANNAKNYGPYNAKWYNYKLCPGPRAKNVTITTSSLIIDQYGAVVTFNVTFTVPAKMEVIKTTVWNIKGDQKNVLLNYKLNKPCQHFFVAGILKQNYRISSNCVIRAGNYNYKTNYTEIAYQFFGSSFFYGDYSFKMYAIATEGNVMCIQINALFSKKV